MRACVTAAAAVAAASAKESDAASVESDHDESLSQAVLDELEDATVRVLWNVSRSGANATNAALIREGGVAALMRFCSSTSAVVQVRRASCDVMWCDVRVACRRSAWHVSMGIGWGGRSSADTTTHVR
jgi:hypothetical protein